MDEYSVFVERLSKPLPTKQDRMDHAIIGMITEIGELADANKKHIFYEQSLNYENILEELGDFAFYFQMFLNEFTKIITYDEKMPSKHPTVLTILKELSYYVSLCDDESYVEDIIYDFNLLLYHYDMTLREVLEYNMEKLNKRYPNGYSNENAKLRLDKQNET